jgi:biotin-(acetyl-CoA carboxylase) ligase
LKNIDIPATSIFNETGVAINKQEFLDKFLSNFENEYDDFLINGIKGEVLC